MYYIVAVIIVLLVLASMGYQHNKENLVSIERDNIKLPAEGIKEDPCFLFENTNRNQVVYMKLISLFEKLSCQKKMRLKNCQKTDYIDGTMDDRLKRELDQITNVILKKVEKLSGFYFRKFYYDNVTEIVDKKGNKNFKYIVFIDDPQEWLQLRIQIDVVKFANKAPQSSAVTCSQVTTPGQETYEIGYPKPDQLFPLPTEVITTGLDVLGFKGVTPDQVMPIKYLYLNCIRVYNSNLVINAEGKCLDDCAPCGNYGISLDHSLFNGPSTPFVEPSCVRNKWPTLPDQPKDRPYEWNCAARSNNWDEKGVFSPPECKTKKCFGIQSSTTPMPLQPEYWPTLATIPRNSGPNYWLFDLTRGHPYSGASADFS